jgi:hypothetical protein
MKPKLYNDLPYVVQVSPSRMEVGEEGFDYVFRTFTLIPSTNPLIVL